LKILIKWHSRFLLLEYCTDLAFEINPHKAEGGKGENTLLGACFQVGEFFISCFFSKQAPS
jgi:hypothetical protein